MLSDHGMFSKSTEEWSALARCWSAEQKHLYNKDNMSYKHPRTETVQVSSCHCSQCWVKSWSLTASGWISCPGGLQVAHPCSDILQVTLPMSLPRAAWTIISSTEQVSFSAEWQKLSYSCVSCVFILPFRCCHTKPSKLSPRQPDFKWGNCWNLILPEWSWIIILATQDLRIGTDCFWRVRSKALRWKMGAGAFILQSLLHLALLSTGKPIA